MNGLALKRIVKDLSLLKKDEKELQARGIYFHVEDDNLGTLKVLIVPKDKREGDLISPYTAGYFLFVIQFGDDFPMVPPKVTFHPMQNYCRMHPNYYENGKVCLSLINTWSSNDWTPSTSIMSLINVLEERFNENGLSFEPSFEMAAKHLKQAYNTAVEYTKYRLCINSFNSPIFSVFKEVMVRELNANFEYLMTRLREMRECNGDVRSARTPCYTHIVTCDYPKMIKELQELRQNCNRG